MENKNEKHKEETIKDNETSKNNSSNAGLISNSSYVDQTARDIENYHTPDFPI